MFQNEVAKLSDASQSFELLTKMARRPQLKRSLPAFIAVCLLVLSSASHIHLRYCLDGDETPVSVHFESKDIHVQVIDGAEIAHPSDAADVESELSLDTLLAKLFKNGPDSTVSGNLTDFALVACSLQVITPVRHESLPNAPGSLSPPSRAPPTIS